MNKKNPKIIIIGAGPCGIGAGWYLHKRGYDNWIIYEKNSYPGGLSASFKDDKEFIWDMGGHVVFSRYRDFNEFLEETLGEKYLMHRRQSWIRIFNRWVPYPFQNNIHYLPKDEFEACLVGLKNRIHKEDYEIGNFKSWIGAKFGKGISDYFMMPLNKKMWSYPLEKISTQWVDKRISSVGIIETKEGINIKYNGDWGPNNTFAYPLYGGMGGIFKKAISKFRNKVKLNNEVYKIDLISRKIFFKNGHEDKFDILISSANLKDLIACFHPQNTQISEISKRLKCNKLLIIGIGLKKRSQDSRTWVYFPEGKYPFFRVTNLSNYSPYNVPDGAIGKFSSLLIEASFSKTASIDRDLIIEKTIKGLIDAGLISESDKKLIESVFSLEVENGYPIPTLDRDEVLNEINGFLQSQNIFSRGRFGAFRYETGNMDDCFMQGFETAQRILK